MIGWSLIIKYLLLTIQDQLYLQRLHVKSFNAYHWLHLFKVKGLFYQLFYEDTQMK